MEREKRKEGEADPEWRENVNNKVGGGRHESGSLEIY